MMALFASVFSFAFAFALILSCTKVPDFPSLEDSSSSFDDYGGSSSSEEVGTFQLGHFTDPRDGKSYKYETDASGKIWMSQNLNYSRDNTIGFCYGVDIYGEDANRDSTSCDGGYGRIYTQAVALDGNPSRGLCPNGWRMPSVADWQSIGVTTTTATTKTMSENFYIYPGNYNLNSQWPPLGWKARGQDGFYWTNAANMSYAFMQYDVDDGFKIQMNTNAATSDYFSVRCITNLCGSSTMYEPSTHFCASSYVYEKCGGATYAPATQGCVDGVVLSRCGDNFYNLSNQQCAGNNTVLTKCGTYYYNELVERCEGGNVVPK